MRLLNMETGHATVRLERLRSALLLLSCSWPCSFRSGFVLNECVSLLTLLCLF